MKSFFNIIAVGFGLYSLKSSFANAGCPILAQREQHAQVRNLESTMRALNINQRSGDGGVPDGGFAAVKQDIAAMLRVSQDIWPADFGHYGGLLIRLAWHCAGSYRETDGRGGCDGGRIRFSPELTWMDNGNLDKALKLLEPIKEKYGSSLSWGDLVSLAGTTAIEDMGGPFFGFCGGRIDDSDGSNSLKLGPSDEQEQIARCLSLDPNMQGFCNLVEGSPIGPTTVGLIYVDPAGPADAPNDPIASGVDIRHTFAIMGFNDTESVALIGGGHAFGKGHGACENPPCGEGAMQGKGENTYTAGFEGAWTTRPDNWDNEFFKNLFDYEWVLIKGPGGMMQWAPNSTDGSTPPDIFMLTTDIALAEDPDYRAISEEYAANITLLEKDFAAAWYRLTSADMGPATRCIGDLVPSPQNFQYTLPNAPGMLADFVGVRSKIQELLDADEANYGAFVSLAYKCASTFRETDYRGGCNGARIRFSPELEWESNAGAADTLATLEAVKEAYPDASYSDIIVLAGQTSIEGAGGNKQPFCGGRVDAEDGSGSEVLTPRVYEPAVVSIRDDMQVKGLSPREGVALAGHLSGPIFSNQFFVDLLTGNGNFTADELALLEEEFNVIVEEYAEDESTFQTEFAAAWKKKVTADRYDGPRDNACTNVNTCTTDPCFVVEEDVDQTLLDNSEDAMEAGESSEGVPSNELLMLQQAALNAARALWWGLSVESYTVEYQNMTPSSLGSSQQNALLAYPWVVEVANTLQVESVMDANGLPVEDDLSEEVPSVDRLFVTIQSAIDQQAAEVEVIYDETYGYPLSVFILYNNESNEEIVVVGDQVSVVELASEEGGISLELHDLEIRTP